VPDLRRVAEAAFVTLLRELCSSGSVVAPTRCGVTEPPKRPAPSSFNACSTHPPDQIRRIATETPIPLNIMVMEGVPSNDELAKSGIARVSYGAFRAPREGSQVAFVRWSRSERAHIRLFSVGNGPLSTSCA
jgi:hypothetical protein